MVFFRFTIKNSKEAVKTEYQDRDDEGFRSTAEDMFICGAEVDILEKRLEALKNEGAPGKDTCSLELSLVSARQKYEEALARHHEQERQFLHMMEQAGGIEELLKKATRLTGDF